MLSEAKELFPSAAMQHVLRSIRASHCWYAQQLCVMVLLHHTNLILLGNDGRLWVEEKQGMQRRQGSTFASIDASRDSCNTGMVAAGKASFSGTKVPWSKPRVSVSAGWKPAFLHEQDTIFR